MEEYRYDSNLGNAELEPIRVIFDRDGLGALERRTVLAANRSRLRRNTLQPALGIRERRKGDSSGRRLAADSLGLRRTACYHLIDVPGPRKEVEGEGAKRQDRMSRGTGACEQEKKEKRQWRPNALKICRTPS